MLSKKPAMQMTLVALVVAISMMTLSGQAPAGGGQRGGGGQGQRGGGQGPQGQGGGGQGRGGQAPAAPVVPVAAAVPTITEVTGPGKMFPALMDFHSGDDMAHFKYEAKEYFVSGTANGQPYKTRIVIRKPVDNSKFSGLIVAEPMHPGGNAWVFHFTHTYTMSTGHIGLEIVTGALPQFVAYNQERYKDLKIDNGQANEILAQVGALIKSKQAGNPLAALPVRKMILGGTSASSAIVITYLPAHAMYKTADMKNIYDGYFPTSNGGVIPRVDVPLIQVPTMTEVSGGGPTTRQDGDAAGDQFRVYEFAGMAHLDTREAEGYYPDPCKNPISRYPMGAYISVALDHLLQWVDKGVVPPRGDRMWLDRNTNNDGSMMALDPNGNVMGGIRNPYVDIPVMKYAVRNEPAVPPIANAHPFISGRADEAAIAAFTNQVCGLAGYQIAMTPAQLKQLYKDKKTYMSRVEKRLDELTKAGWSLPVYRDYILADAAKVTF